MYFLLSASVGVARAPIANISPDVSITLSMVRYSKAFDVLDLRALGKSETFMSTLKARLSVLGDISPWCKGRL